jgi:predicted Rossmann fold flavoprotein
MDDKSSSVRNALMSMLRNVEIKIDAKVSGFIVKKKSISGVKMEDGEIIEAKYFILATGGTSHPETGSTGDAYKWLEDIGHKIVPPIPSLVPIAIKEQWVKDLQGLSLNNCKLTVFLDDKKKIVKKGRLLFTHFGISGPMIINLSGEISKLLKIGNVRIELDLMPKEDYATLKVKMKNLFEKNKNKLLKNCLLEILPERIVSTIIKLSKVDGEVPIHSVFREERAEIEKILKHMNMTVDHLLGPDKSIVTSGGVSCDEVDFKTMHSKLYPNLAFAGDILDIERPSGGYSLQICWSTGFVAGRNME